MLAKLIARGVVHDQEKQKDHVHGQNLHPHLDSGQLIPFKPLNPSYNKSSFLGSTFAWVTSKAA